MKHSNFNRDLGLVGVMAILMTALIFYFDRAFDESILVLCVGIPVYLFYMATINSLLFIGEFVSNQFSIQPGGKFREISFRCFYWVSIAIPFLYPAFAITLF